MTQSFVVTPSENKNEQQYADYTLRTLSGANCRVLSVGPGGDRWLTIELKGSADMYPNGVCKSGSTVDAFPARVASGNPNYKWIGAWTKCIKSCSWHPNGQLEKGYTARVWVDLAPARQMVGKNAEVRFDETGKLTSVTEGGAF